MIELRRLLHRPTDPRPYALFRILFGCLMLYEVVFYGTSGLLEAGIVGPKLHFPYEGSEWLGPMGLQGMRALVASMALMCLFIVAGVFYRFAIVLLFLGLAYIFLLDKAYYNNHTYLFILISFLLIWIPADRAWTPKDRGGGRTVPYWCWWILRMQIVIVYFYGGIAKLNTDWIVHGEPMRTLLASGPSGPMSDLLSSEIVLYFLTIGGLLFDLLAGPLLWWKKSRPYAIAMVFFFNITNHFIFDDIGVFPFFMIAATLLFFDPEEMVRWFGTPDRKKRKNEAVAEVGSSSFKLTELALGTYLLVQLLFPLRWIALGVDPDWSGVAQRCSWRMKISTRAPLQIAYNVEEPLKNDSHPVQLGDFINNYQQTLCAYDPRSAVRFARWLKEAAARRGMSDTR